MHPPNGGFRNIREAARFKRMGALAGACDLIIFNSPHLFTEQKTYKYKGLAIELKVGKNKTTPSQDLFIQKLESNGWLTYIIYDFESFQNIIEDLYPSIVSIVDE